MTAASSIPARRCRTRRATSPRSCSAFRPTASSCIWYGAPGAYGRNGLDHAIADAAIMSQVGRPSGARAVDALGRAWLGAEGPGHRAGPGRRGGRAGQRDRLAPPYVAADLDGYAADRGGTHRQAGYCGLGRHGARPRSPMPISSRTPTWPDHGEGQGRRC